MSDRINELNMREYRRRLEENPTVIIPTGACEVYGPHLPMGSDFLVARAIADRVAARTGALVAPTLEIGESSALASFPETFTVSRRLLEAFLSELVDQLVQDGARRILFLTGHAGNVDTASYIAKLAIHRRDDLVFGQIDWWRFVQKVAGPYLTGTGYMAHGHASEAGTSVLLYLYPDLVDVQALTSYDPGPADGGWPDVIQYRRLKDRTPIAQSGDATKATREKGEHIVRAAVDRIVAYVESEAFQPGKVAGEGEGK